jgi:hypothetical protein
MWAACVAGSVCVDQERIFRFRISREAGTADLSARLTPWVITISAQTCKLRITDSTSYMYVNQTTENKSKYAYERERLNCRLMVLTVKRQTLVEHDIYPIAQCIRGKTNYIRGFSTYITTGLSS